MSEPYVYARNGTCVVITTKCTLNCAHCLNYQPYIKDKQHFDVDNLKRDIRLFFRVHDKIEHFSLTGGEPFLHPDFEELLLHVYYEHKYKLVHFGTATNCTIVPSDSLCEILRNCEVEVVCDRYPESIHYDEVLAKFADTAGILFADKRDCTDMDNLIMDKGKGYVEFCRLCDGFPPMNNRYDPGGATQWKDGDL